jgi:hypothetical protein
MLVLLFLSVTKGLAPQRSNAVFVAGGVIAMALERWPLPSFRSSDRRQWHGRWGSLVTPPARVYRRPGASAYGSEVIAVARHSGRRISAW